MKKLLSFVLMVSLLCLSPLTAYAFYDGSTAAPGVIMGRDYTIYLDENGTMWAAGWFLGNKYSVPTKITDNVKEAVSAGSKVGIIKNDNSFWIMDYKNNPPVKKMDNVVSAYVSSENVAVVTSDSKLWMWGDNTNGQLGQGYADQYGVVYDEPVLVMENVRSAALINDDAVAAVKNDNTLWIWGRNSNGVLGDGYQAEYVYTPMKLLDDVSEVCFDYLTVFALKTDGSVWGWGENNYGQIGNNVGGEREDFGYGEFIFQLTPSKGFENAEAFATSGWTSAVIDSDGGLWMCGDNDFNQCLGGDSYRGSNGRYVQSVPRKVMDNVKKASLASYHTAVLKEDGTLWTFGDAEYCGQNIQSGIADLAKVMDNVADVFTRDSTTLAVKKDGTVWITGGNYGSFGVESNDVNYTFVQVPGINLKKAEHTGELSEGDNAAGWRQDGDTWYFFDDQGKMQTGWYQDTDGSWYFLNTQQDGGYGRMLSGWQWIDGYSYYFDASGKMAAGGLTPDGFQVNELGQWVIDSVPQYNPSAGIWTK